MADLELVRFLTDGLGDSSYLVASAGEAALVDPQRDAWRFLDVAEARGWRVRHVLETHVHNDYLSGALEVAAATGAEIVAPARGGYAFRHRGVDEGDAVEVGGLRLSARATPGHTPEHLAWEASRIDAVVGAAAGGSVTGPELVFSGGSLLVGNAGRTDLLGDDRTAELTAAQFRSLRRLAELPDDVRVLPTHGAGSFCVVGDSDPRGMTTIGAERRTNPLLAAPDAAWFADALLAGAGRFPAYYARMGPLNRSGPPVVGRTAPPPTLDPAALADRARAGVSVIDGRDRDAFAAAHVPGSLNIELSGSFASYVGWLLPFGAPLALVLPNPLNEALEEARLQLFRIGFDRVEGVLGGGLDAWQAAGRPAASYPTTTMATLEAELARGETPRLLDVRQPVEWAEDGVIPGSQTIFVADLPARLGELAGPGQVNVVCRSGQRATIAASLLDAAGIPVRLVARGGAGSTAEASAAG
jgi:glyoxylase-like metal-dependent hydrolase (beta-lactamase superfamily II)/rhodanese-related sulfurtransferase